MPRDIFAQQTSQEPILTESPEIKSPPSQQTDSMGQDESEESPSNEYTIFRDDRHDRQMVLSDNPPQKDGLHPHVQVLSISDLDACIALENATFPETERCTREKFVYRLTVCPELCLGLFSTISTDPDSSTKAASEAARAFDSTNPDHKSVLLGHVIGTLTASSTVTDTSMEIPSDFSSTQGQPQDKTGDIDSEQPPKPGHDDLGRTLAIHSVSVLPQFQNKGLGKILLRSYLQRMESAGVADGAAIIAHPELTEWYVQNFGFEDKGASSVKLGNGEWQQLTYEFSDAPGLWA